MSRWPKVVRIFRRVKGSCSALLGLSFANRKFWFWTKQLQVLTMKLMLTFKKCKWPQCFLCMCLLHILPHFRVIHRRIRENFASATILTIAHRLNTIMDSDRVLVLDDGRVVEFDSPSALLAKKDGVFKSMVDKSKEAHNS